MAENLPKPSPIQEGLRLMSNCPLCKKQHSPENARILLKKKDTHLVHIICPHCTNAVLAVMVVSGMGLSSVGMVTDLSREDVLRLQTVASISEDELLDLHEMLKNNKLNYI